MESKPSTKLSTEQMLQYQERGYCFPIRVFEDSEVAEFRARYLDYVSQNSERLKALLPREQGVVLSMTAFCLRWVYRMVSHPNVLDGVESILGSNLLVWDSRWFSKMPGDRTYVAWHQDALYWGLHPPNVTTAWIALSDSTPENGGMRVVPGTHQGDLLPDKQTYAPDNVLGTGQEIAVEVDEAQAVDIVLRPGEMSLHHAGIVHGSNRNASDKPRIGIAVRYITPEVVQAGAERQLALLVRGRDAFGHYDLIDPPKEDWDSAGIQAEAVRRMRKNVIPKNSPGPR